MHIGCHLSIAKGLSTAAQDAVDIGASTFAFFLRNPRGGNARELDLRDIAKCRAILEAHKFGKLVAHAPYTLNPCAARPELREYAVETMIDDLKRLDHLPGNYYNFHPGSHVKQGAEVGIELTIDFLKRVLPHAGFSTVLIETMSGKGSEIGRNFDEVAAILHGIQDRSRLGVCLDTCHIWDGGYDIVHHLDDVLDAFEEKIGLQYLYAIHLNDSMNALDSHKDRHACIGTGCIGFEALRKVVSHPRLRDLPFIFETPNELSGYRREIAMFRDSLSESSI